MGSALPDWPVADTRPGSRLWLQITYLWAIDEEGNLYKYGEVEGKKHQFWDKVFKDVGEEVNGMAIIDTLAWLMLILFGSFAWKTNRKRNAPEIRPEL